MTRCYRTQRTFLAEVAAKLYVLPFVKKVVHARVASSITGDDDQKYSLGVFGNAVVSMDGFLDSSTKVCSSLMLGKRQAPRSGSSVSALQ